MDSPVNEVMESYQRFKIGRCNDASKRLLLVVRSFRKLTSIHPISFRPNRSLCRPTFRTIQNPRISWKKSTARKSIGCWSITFYSLYWQRGKTYQALFINPMKAMYGLFHDQDNLPKIFRHKRKKKKSFFICLVKEWERLVCLCEFKDLGR